MCGISGGVWLQYGSKKKFDENVEFLFRKNSLRGFDGGGYATLMDTGVVLKQSAQIRDMELEEIGSTFISVSRAQPLPELDSIDASPPFVGERYAIVHNGTISNDKELNVEHELGLSEVAVDTEVSLALIEKLGVKPAIEEMVGGFAFALVDEGGLTLVKNFKTLWLALTYEGFYFASEREWLEEMVDYEIWSEAKIVEMPCDTILTVSNIGKFDEIKFKKKIWSSLPSRDNNKAVVVMSGGIDSVTSAYIAKRLHNKDVVLLNVDYGQRAAERESAAVDYFGEVLDAEVVHLDMRQLGAMGASPLTDKSLELPMGMKSVESTLCWTPARNMLFISYAASVCEAKGAGYIYYGNNMEEEGTGYGDNDLSFIYAFNHLLKYGTLQGLKIHRALARLMKPEILVLGEHLGVDYSRTWSCDQGFEKPCGDCGCCTTRRYSFKRAGMKDEQTYLNPLRDIYPWEGTKKTDLDDLLNRVKMDYS